MKNSLNQQTDPHKTVRQVLPYEFRMRPDGKMLITNTRSQVLVVSKGQVVNILGKEDLDVHRRKMYEAALEEFEKAEKKVVH